MNSYTFSCPRCGEINTFDRYSQPVKLGDKILCRCLRSFPVQDIKLSRYNDTIGNRYILTLKPEATQEEKPVTPPTQFKGKNVFTCPCCRCSSSTDCTKAGEIATCSICGKEVKLEYIRTHVEYDHFVASKVELQVNSAETTTTQTQEEPPHKFKFRCLWCQDDRYIDEAKIGDKVTCSICSKESKLTGIKLTRFSAIKVQPKLEPVKAVKQHVIGEYVPKVTPLMELPYKALCHKCFNLSDIDLVVGKRLVHGSTFCCPRCKAAHKVEEFVTLQSHIGVILSPAPEKQGLSDVIEEMAKIAADPSFFDEMMKLK